MADRVLDIATFDSSHIQPVPRVARARTDISRDAIQVVQEKTDQEERGEKLVIPIHPALRRELRAQITGHFALQTTEFGKPFIVKGFSNFMSKAIRGAGLPRRCVLHGLRKAAARRLAEAGCSSKEIGAITGHKSLEEIERYTRKADQVRLAQAAMEKQKLSLPQRKQVVNSGKPLLEKVANPIKRARKIEAS